MTNKLTRTMSFLTAAAGLAVMTGCSIDADVHDHDHHDYVEERRPVVVEDRPPVVVERPGPPPVIIERGGEYRAAGNAIVVARGHQKKDFDAPGHGVVTVIDDRTSRVEVQREVRRGDHLAFDPDKNKAWMNGHTILNHDLDSHHIYTMYFEPR